MSRVRRMDDYNKLVKASTWDGIDQQTYDNVIELMKMRKIVAQEVLKLPSDSLAADDAENLFDMYGEQIKALLGL